MKLELNEDDEFDVEYVAGFLFSTDTRQVALISKKKPEWQAGKLNGIGGSYNKKESPLGAMVRKFYEETGFYQPEWTYFCSKTGLSADQTESWRVKFFISFGDLTRIKHTSDEKPVICDVANLPADKVLPDVRWLIPMALSIDDQTCQSFVVDEYYGDL